MTGVSAIESAALCRPAGLKAFWEGVPSLYEAREHFGMLFGKMVSKVVEFVGHLKWISQCLESEYMIV
jgi:hypothetical protein